MVEAEEFDALSSLAPLFRVRPELQVLCRLGQQWASPHDHEPIDYAPFHMVTDGTCVIEVTGEPPATLFAGDIALLPHGDAHVVRGPILQCATRPAPVVVWSTRAIAIKSNTEQPEAELICGRLSFEQPHGNLARAALPRLIIVRTAEDREVERLRGLLVAIRDELVTAAPGARAICHDLASALLVMVLRVHCKRHNMQVGLLALLGQRQTARALTAMMEDPGRDWSLDAIAASAAVSRATLVRDFRRLTKATPFGVLTEIRLGIARHAIAASDRPLPDIAADVGYRSESAFSRAFKRHFKCSPGATRSP